MIYDEKCCTDCKFSVDRRDGAGLVCRYGPFERACSYQRDYRSPCGRDASLFEPKRPKDEEHRA